MAGTVILFLETQAHRNNKRNSFFLEVVSDGALIVQASTQPGAHLVACEQVLHRDTCWVVAGEKGCFKMLFGVEVVLRLQCQSPVPRGGCSVEIFYMRN